LRRNGAGWIVGSALCIMLMVSLFQLLAAMRSPDGGDRAVRLLYQVSRFQMELLNSSLANAAVFQQTDQLNEVKQAAYSAHYAHERLVLALGERRLANLEGLTQLMQYILRLQIGGQRALRADELSTLQEAGKLFAQMYETYGKLFTSGGAIASSQNSRLVKLDKELAELLRNKQLQ